jgi:hemerythrin-like metal-binding protein
MALIEWQENFAIGIASVDYEHRQLIELINSLHGSLSANAAKEDINRFLGEVDARISAHFALEEKEMRDMRYDQFAEHKADHERLLDQIRDISDAFESGAYANYDEVLKTHLKAWFTEHFSTQDARLHRFLDKGQS